MNLIQGDCLTEMRKMVEGGVDVVFTSPPYNDTGKGDKSSKNSHKKYEVDEYKENWLEWQIECIDEMRRVAKRQVIYNVQPIKSNKADVYRLIGHYADEIEHILIWYKPNAQPQNIPNRIGNAYELVIIFGCKDFDVLKTNSTNYRNLIVKNIKSNNEYSKIHGAVMSEDFCDEIIREFTQEGDTVLDCFMGLGTTGLSCIKYDRDFVGIELYPKYYEIAKDRIEGAKAQMKFF